MKRKISAILLSLVIVISISISASAAKTVQFSDMPNDWSTTALQNAVNNGLLKGNNGLIRPTANLTRAEMATIVNSAFGANQKASLNAYTDVAASEWYYDQMAKAVQMGTFVGSGSKLNPNSSITREEAFVALSRALKLSGAAEIVLDKFSDKASISEWAKDGIASLVKAGYINGSNGQIKPKQLITRAEFAQIMDNLLKKYINVTGGAYTSDCTGNVMINIPGVTLKDLTINGDLIIGDGVGNGNVTLDGVKVMGRMIVRGGGENSIKIIGNSNLQNIIVAKVDGKVRVYSGDGTEIGEVIVDGKDDVIIEGKVGNVTVLANNTTVTATNADIKTAIIKGENTNIVIGEGSAVNMLQTSAPNTLISGAGTLTQVLVQAGANGANIKTANTKITVSAGVNGTIGSGGQVIPAGSTSTNNSAVTKPAEIPAGSGGGGGGGHTTYYRVTFNSNGGSTVNAITNVTPGATVTLPAEPTLSGFIFVGWFSDNTTFANAFTSSTAVTANITVYAKWREDTACGYVFDNNLTATPQTIAVGSDVVFNSNGPLYGVAHTLDSSAITVNDAGIYNIQFSICTNSNNPQTWGIAVNGEVKSLFNCSGQTIVQSAKLALNAGDTVSIRNVATNPNPATLRLEVNSAWVQIDKVDSTCGYVFDNQTTTAQTVTLGSDLVFNSNGPMQNVTHETGTSILTVNDAGIYNVTFAINTTGNNPQTWGIAVNGEIQSLFSCAGQTIVQSAKLSLNAGDRVSIRNVATNPNPAALRLNCNAAWVLIDKIDSTGGYVFDNNAATAQTIALGSDVVFNNNGPLQDVAHEAGTANITVNGAGIYNIQFGICTTTNNPQTWGIAVNDNIKSVFACAGQTIVSGAKLSLNAGDRVSIRNVATNPNPATLRTGYNAAWLLIDKAAGTSDNNGGSSPSIVAVNTITVTGEADAAEVRNGLKLQMGAVIEPADATNQTISWNVSTLAGGTATITSTGLLTATGIGTVRVRATNVASGVYGIKDITVTVPDKSALTAAINAEFSDGAARTTYVLTQTDYTTVSWTAYTGKITAAIAVEGDATKNQVQIDSAKNAIGTQKGKLVFAGKADLDAAKLSASSKIQSDYTPLSWAGLAAALALPETTNAEVVAKTGAINDAIAALVLDTTPAPDFAADYPKAGNIGYTVAGVLVKVNESGKGYWVVVADGSAAPNAVQVKAGQDSTGTAVTAGLSGSVDLAANTEATMNITGLTANTAYNIYVIAEDSESTPNLQDAPVKVDITTTAAPIPVLAVSGTLTDGANEQEVKDGNQTIVLTLENATFVEDVATDASKRDALLAGLAAGRLYSEFYAGTGLLIGDQSTYATVLNALEGRGWTTANDQVEWAEVISAIDADPASIVLNGDRTQATITIPAVAGYDPLLSQTIMVTVPDELLVGAGVTADLTATAPSMIDAVLGALSWNGLDENNIVAGGKVITLTTTWSGGFANKVGMLTSAGGKQTAFIDYFAAQSETGQWAKVKSSLYETAGAVVYTAGTGYDTVTKTWATLPTVTITLLPVADYNIADAQQIRYYFSTGLTGQTGGGGGSNGASFPIGIAVPMITIDAVPPIGPAVFEENVASESEVISADGTAAIDTAVFEAKIAKEGVAISADGTDVPVGTKWVTQAVNDALDAAITMATNAKATAATDQDAADAAAALDAAVDTYNTAKADGTQIEA